MKRLAVILIFVNFISANIHNTIKRSITNIAKPNSMQSCKTFDSSNGKRIHVLPGLRDGPCPKINAKIPRNLMEKYATGIWHWACYLSTDYGKFWPENRLRCLNSKLSMINNHTNSFENYAIDSITNQQIIDHGEYRWRFDGTILEMTTVIPGPYHRGLYFGTIGQNGTNYYRCVGSDSNLNDYVIWYSCSKVGDRHTSVGTISTRKPVMSPSTVASIKATIENSEALRELYVYRNDPDCTL